MMTLIIITWVLSGMISCLFLCAYIDEQITSGDIVLSLFLGAPTGYLGLVVSLVLFLAFYLGRNHAKLFSKVLWRKK